MSVVVVLTLRVWLLVVVVSALLWVDTEATRGERTSEGDSIISSTELTVNRPLTVEAVVASAPGVGGHSSYSSSSDAVQGSANFSAEVGVRLSGEEDFRFLGVEVSRGTGFSRPLPSGLFTTSVVAVVWRSDHRRCLAWAPGLITAPLGPGVAPLPLLLGAISPPLLGVVLPPVFVLGVVLPPVLVLGVVLLPAPLLGSSVPRGLRRRATVLAFTPWTGGRSLSRKVF